MKWEKVKLGDIATCIQPGPFGSQLHNSDYSKEGTPIIMPKDIVGGAIVHSGLLKVSEEHVKRLSRHQVYEGNLMVARKGDVRKCAYITANENGWMTGSDCLKVVLDESKCYPKFIYYQLRSEHIGRWLEKVSIGATMPSLNTGLLSGIEMVLPPIEIQKQIAGILSVYDDLIENNQKQIKLLEEAGQRLYKEWFVDLHFPGHENTKIVDGVPEGWQYEKLGDLVKTTSGGTPSRRKSEYYVNGNIRWIKTKELNDRFIFETEEHITEDAVKNSSAKVLPEGALIVAMYGATIGKIGITAAEMACNQACCAFISFDDMISKEYLYCWLMDNREYLVSQGKGAAQSNLSQEMIRNFSLLCPDKKVIKKFTEIVTTILENKRVLENKILMLSKARDDLLPKLMSGEVEV